MPNIKSLLTSAASSLRRTSPSAPLDAEILLSHAIRKPKEFLYSHPESELTKKQISDFQSLISQRKKGIPVAYLTNHKEFFGLDFYVDNRVLIPRPETEILVEEVIKKISPPARLAFAPAKRARGGDRPSGARAEGVGVVDIGTGSGCIAITLAKYFPRLKIYATDISEPALAVARKNAARHRAKIIFTKGNLLAPLKNKKIDVLVSNLPYGWRAWKNNTSVETKGLSFEPAVSLFTEEKGLKLYRQLFEQIKGLKNKPKLVALEFDPRQTTELKKLAKKYLPAYKLEIKKDLAGLNRVLILTLEP